MPTLACALRTMLKQYCGPRNHISKQDEGNHNADDWDTLFICANEISVTTLFPDYEYSTKVEKIPNERNRHKKNHIVKDLDYYKKYPGKDKSYVVAKVGEDILLQSQLDTLNGNRWC
uniref:Uncharacterized protein n=1 Tax=Cacopsylla melanoneura TaxID=428564 RepID=A0A8D9EZ11_9HEMI